MLISDRVNAPIGVLQMNGVNFWKQPFRMHGGRHDIGVLQMNGVYFWKQPFRMHGGRHDIGVLQMNGVYFWKQPFRMHGGRHDIGVLQMNGAYFWKQPFRMDGGRHDIGVLYCVDLEVWSKLAKCVRIMRIASKCVRNFDCNWQHVNAFSRYVTLIRVLLSQIISYTDTKVQVLVVIEYKCANMIMCTSWYFYSILQGQQSVSVNSTSVLTLISWNGKSKHLLKIIIFRLFLIAHVDIVFCCLFSPLLIQDVCQELFRWFQLC